MITAELALSDLKAIRQLEPEDSLRLLSILIDGQEQQIKQLETVEQEDSSLNSILDVLKFRRVATIIGSAIAHVLRTTVGIITTGVSVLVRLLLNPAVLGTLVIGGAIGAVVYALKNKQQAYDTDKTRTIPQQKINDYSKYLKESSVVDLIIQGANVVGVDPQLMLQIAKAESAFGTNTVNPHSKAQGIFQIIPSTWNSHYEQFDEKYGIPKNDPHDVLSASIFSAAYIKDVLTKQLGRTPNATEVYLMYVFGPGGGRNLIRNYERDSSQLSFVVQSRIPSGWSQIKANKEYFYDRRTGRPKTLAETYAMAQARITLTNTELSIVQPKLEQKQEPAIRQIPTQDHQIPVKHKGRYYRIKE